MEYNYTKFNSKEYDFSESQGFQIGDIVPNFELFSLSGDKLQLFEDGENITVLETGSVTCPLYAGNIKRMNILVEEYPDIDFKVLYVREAHPGKKIHTHSDIEGKIDLANTLKNYFPENRKILVDEINGDTHRKLGLLPNILLVIGKNREILYKMDWNNTDTLSRVLSNIKVHKPIQDIVPKFRPAPPTITLPVLFRAGSDALFDFLIHIPRVIFERVKKFYSSKDK